MIIYVRLQLRITGRISVMSTAYNDHLRNILTSCKCLGQFESIYDIQSTQSTEKKLCIYIF